MESKTTGSKFFQLSVPGSDLITDSQQPFVIRIIFFAVLITSASVSIIVLTERSNYYYSYPVNLEYEIQQEYAIDFPMITLCTFYANNDEESNNQTLDKDILMSIGTFQGIFKYCGYNNRQFCGEDAWKKQYTVYGPCFTLGLDNKLEYFDPNSGYVLLMNTFIEQANQEVEYVQWKVLIHEHLEDAIYGVMLNGHDVFLGTAEGIHFAHKKYMYEDVPNRPCTEKSEAIQCMLTCFDEKMTDLLKCKMPFITTIGRADVPLCSDGYSGEYFERLQQFLQESGHCRCKRACVEDYFELRLESRDKSEFETNNQTSIYVLPIHEESEVMKEKRAYTLYALICDIGGTLGLYLGVCILSVIEIFYQSAYIIKQTLIKKQK